MVSQTHHAIEAERMRDGKPRDRRREEVFGYAIFVHDRQREIVSPRGKVEPGHADSTLMSASGQCLAYSLHKSGQTRHVNAIG